MKRSLLKVVLWAVLLSVSGWAAPMGALAAKPKIVIGSKNFTEQYVLGHIIAELLEAHGYPTERKLGLGGNDIVFSAMKRGDIHVYPEYTGTAWAVHLGHALEIGLDPEQLYEDVTREFREKHGLEFLPALGFNNTYVFAAPRALVNKHNLTKVSDLIPIAKQLTLGGSIDFMGDRPDGIRGVEKVYGMKFRRNRAVESGLLFQALQLRQVDLIVAFATHGQIAAMDLVMLTDDRQLFPPYDTGIVVRSDVLKANPELRTVLGKLEGKINEATMARLNYEVDGHRKDPRAVARAFLQELGLIK